MTTATPDYSIGDAAEEVGENRNLVSFLVTFHQIPTREEGRSKRLDAAGLDRLRVAVADYRRRASSARIA